jgi:hypothetical protein
MLMVGEEAVVGEDIPWADTEGMFEWVVGELAEWVVPMPAEYTPLSETVRQQWPHLIEMAPLLADRLWEKQEIESTVMNARVTAAARLAAPVQALIIQSVQESWTRTRLVGAMTGLIEDYRKRHASSPELPLEGDDPRATP